MSTPERKQRWLLVPCQETYCCRCGYYYSCCLDHRCSCHCYATPTPATIATLTTTPAATAAATATAPTPTRTATCTTRTTSTTTTTTAAVATTTTTTTTTNNNDKPYYEEQYPEHRYCRDGCLGVSSQARTRSSLPEQMIPGRIG